MRVFDFTLLSGYEFSGVDVAQGFRARLFGVNEEEDNLQNIEDEDTPLAAGGTAKDGIKTWWWIAAAVAAITGKGVYDNRRRKPAKSDDSEDNSDEK